MSVTCFCSVIYPDNLIFFNSFLKSLESQTDKDFILLLFNDGVENLSDYVKNLSISYEEVIVRGSINDIRTEVFNYLKESEFKFVIFGDTDDYFPENRVAVNKLLLAKNDIVANDLCLVTAQEKTIAKYYWKERKEVKQLIDLSAILKYNFLGLGNTAIRTVVLPLNVTFNKETVAVDWMLFTRILMNNVKVCFTSKTFIYYRQHENNVIGRKPLTLEKFKTEFKVKLNHYTILGKENKAYSEIANKYQLLEERVKEMNSKDLSKYYFKKNNPFWWEEIQLCKFN